MYKISETEFQLCSLLAQEVIKHVRYLVRGARLTQLHTVNAPSGFEHGLTVQLELVLHGGGTVCIDITEQSLVIPGHDLELAHAVDLAIANRLEKDGILLERWQRQKVNSWKLNIVASVRAAIVQLQYNLSEN